MLSSANDEVLGVIFIRVIDNSWDGNHVNRDAMAPPQLTTDTPVLNVLKPVKPGFFVTFWQNQKVFITDGVAGTFCHVFAINVPLRFQKWFNNVV